MDRTYKVRLHGMELWWLKDADGGGALAPLEHCGVSGDITFKAALFGDSYAHVMEDGRIMRYRKEIGHRNDLEIIGKP